MKDLITGMMAGGVVALIGLAVLAVVASVYTMAKFNFIFTMVNEGQAKAVKRLGKFRKIIMSYKGHGLDEEWNVVSLEEAKKKNIKLRPEPPRLFGGLRIVGIPFIDMVHIYKFKWTSYEQVEEDGKTAEKPVTTEKEIDYIFVQDDIYYTFVKEAETSEMLPLSISLLLTLRVLNPYKALFKIQKWLETTLNKIKPSVRAYVGTKKYEDMVSKVEEEKRNVKTEIFDRLQVIKDEMAEYGVEFADIEIPAMELSGPRGEKYIELSTKQYEADKEKTRIETLANADARRLDTVFRKVKEFGETGLYLKTLETLETAGKGPSNTVIFPLGALKDILSGWIGKKGERNENT